MDVELAVFFSPPIAVDVAFGAALVSREGFSDPSRPSARSIWSPLLLVRRTAAGVGAVAVMRFESDRTEFTVRWDEPASG